MNMATTLHDERRERLREDFRRLQEEGVPEDLARRIIALEPLSQALDIMRVANVTKASIQMATKAIFAIRDSFHLDKLAAASEALAAGDYFDRLAVNSSLATVASAQRALAKAVIAASPGSGDFAAWKEQNEPAASRVAQSLADMLNGRALTLAKLTVAVAQLRDLAAA
jgi:glutamate dehydrogenase